MSPHLYGAAKLLVTQAAAVRRAELYHLFGQRPVVHLLPDRVVDVVEPEGLLQRTGGVETVEESLRDCLVFLGQVVLSSFGQRGEGRVANTAPGNMCASVQACKRASVQACKRASVQQTCPVMSGTAAPEAGDDCRKRSIHSRPGQPAPSG